MVAASPALGAERRLLIQTEPQILPVRVGLFNQADLPVAFPFLDLVFPRLRRLSRVVRFHPDKALNVVFACMGCAASLPVGQHTGRDIVRMACIQRTILAVGHDVRIERHDIPPETAISEPYMPQANRKRLAPSHLRRYLRRQVSIPGFCLMHRAERFRDSPLPPQGAAASRGTDNSNRR